jgi:hypothetical protein
MGLILLIVQPTFFFNDKIIFLLLYFDAALNVDFHDVFIFYGLIL